MISLNKSKDLNEILNNPEVQPDVKQLALLFQIRNNLIIIKDRTTILAVIGVLLLISAILSSCGLT